MTALHVFLAIVAVLVFAIVVVAVLWWQFIVYGVLVLLALRIMRTHKGGS